MRVHTVTEAPCPLCAHIEHGIMAYRAVVNKHRTRLVDGFGFPLPWRCRECGWPIGREWTERLEPDDAARIAAVRARKWGT